MGDYFPVTADHNNIWYPSAVGTALFSLKNVILAVLPRKNMKNGLGLRIQFSCRKAGLLAIFTVMVLTLTKPMWWRKTGLCTMPSTKMGANIAHWLSRY